jgi:hypothetical protein
MDTIEGYLTEGNMIKQTSDASNDFPRAIVSDELKPGRPPRFVNGDRSATDRNMRDPRIAKLAFQAAYVRMTHLKKLPSEN